jgi:4-hydroxy-2-oxoglutarate aldolase
MSVNLRGVFAPVVTTFSTENGEVDVKSFEANVAAHLAAGLHGIVVTGSTGEAALLDANERAVLVEATRRVTPSDKAVIVGTGAESTRTCLAQTREAARRGADAVLVVAPHYYGSSMNAPALRAHYLRVADESPVPLMLYTIPKYMHFALEASLVAELAKHENIIGMKDSSGNRDLWTAYMQSQSPTFAVLTGNAQMFHHAMATGGTGGILAGALFAPAIALDIFDAVRRGDEAAATAAQARFTPMGAKIVAELGVPGVKAAMDRVGLVGGPVRSPLQPLDDGQRDVVYQTLESAELAAA